MRMARLLVIAYSSGLAWAQNWESIAPVPTGGAAREYAVALRSRATLVALGGKPFTTPGEGDGVVHALTGGVWSTLPHLDGEGPLIRQGAGIDDLGRIIFFGGVREGDGEPGHARVYDLVLGVRQSIAPRGAAAPDDYFAYATDEAQRIYSLGGSSWDGTGISGYAERYIGSTNSWEPIAPMPIPVLDAAAVSDGAGHILVLGGLEASGLRSANVARYDIATNTWSNDIVADSPVAVSGARALRGADGLIYLTGGRSGSGGGVVEARCWIYRAETNTWIAGPTMLTPRMHFAAVRGDDSYLYVFGGSNFSGGTNACERLYTPVCPQFIVQPAPVGVWTSGAARFSASVVGGSPMSYRWRKDGAPLSDGPTGTGSTVAGSSTSTLTISECSSADVGAYDVIATNPCGSAQSDAATMSLRNPPTAQTRWTVTNLHPVWADGASIASSIENGRIVGSAVMATTLPDGRVFALNHPVVWDSNLNPTDITPPGSVGGAIYDQKGDFMVGWFWHTWQCWGGTQYWTCAWQSAGYWSGDPPVFQERHTSGSEFDAIVMTDGQSMVGYATFDGSGGVHYSVATHHVAPNYWPSTVAAPSASSASLAAVDGTDLYGTIHTAYPAPVAHAARWTNGGAVFIDLHPPGYARSWVADAAAGVAVGTAYVGETAHSAMWVNGGFVDLHPITAGSSSAGFTKEGLQAGLVDGVPGLWLGSAQSFVALSALAPDGFSSAFLSDFEIAPDGTMTLLGGGFNTVTGRAEALLWRPVNTIPGDTNCDGTVSVGDIGGLVLALTNPNAYADAFPQCDIASADVNGDGSVTVSDIGPFVALLTGA